MHLTFAKVLHLARFQKNNENIGSRNVKFHKTLHLKTIGNKNLCEGEDELRLPGDGYCLRPIKQIRVMPWVFS